MTISKKQLLANRRNAQKSTGPKTKEGKRISSQNGVKHGLYSKKATLASPAIKEDTKEYAALIDSLYDLFVPVGVREERLVRIMADCIWKSRRAVNAENHYLENRIKDILAQDNQRDDNGKPADRYTLIVSNLIPSDSIGEVISRAEMRLSRQLSRALSYLDYYQKTRMTKTLLKRWEAILKSRSEPI